jgi:hypothetical protein
MFFSLAEHQVAVIGNLYTSIQPTRQPKNQYSRQYCFTDTDLRSDPKVSANPNPCKILDPEL